MGASDRLIGLASRNRIAGSSVAVVGIGVVVALAMLLRPSSIHEPALPAPTHLDPEVREALKATMHRHGLDMRELMVRVLVLDGDGVARLAGQVFDDAQWPSTKPGGSPVAWSAALPPRFFALHDQLKQEARSVVMAVARHDATGMADHFGALTKTCVLCHQAYLFEAPVRSPIAAP